MINERQQVRCKYYSVHVDGVFAVTRAHLPVLSWTAIIHALYLNYSSGDPEDALILSKLPPENALRYSVYKFSEISDRHITNPLDISHYLHHLSSISC